MRAFLTTGGKRHRISITIRGQQFTAVVDGETFTGSIDTGGGTVTVRDRAIPYRVRAGGLELAGKHRSVEWEPDLGAREEASMAGEGVRMVRPPMPGRVVAVLVAAGDRVAKGQRLLVLEAMKMQNEVPAPAEGIVRAVLVKAGDSVGAGDTLLELS